MKCNEKHGNKKEEKPFQQRKKVKKREREREKSPKEYLPRWLNKLFFVRHLRPKEDQILSTREKRKVLKKRPKRSTSRYGYFDALFKSFHGIIFGAIRMLFGRLFGASSKPQHEKDGPNTGPMKGGPTPRRKSQPTP